jgi:hypothetical protein
MNYENDDSELIIPNLNFHNLPKTGRWFSEALLRPIIRWCDSLIDLKKTYFEPKYSPIHYLIRTYHGNPQIRHPKPHCPRNNQPS